MRVKTFRGTNAAQVMAQIKKELGPEAVILSSQTRREDGAGVCEIMAAVEPDDSGQEDAMPPYGEADRTASGPAWEKEWSELKGHLNALLKPHLNLETLPARQKMAMEYLQREGVEEHILMGLYRQLTTSANVSLLAELGKAARIKPMAHFTEKFQLVAGPSGAGKTTALLRMALAAKRARPQARICVLNCDGRSVGGKAMLKRYAELSGLIYAEASEPEDMTKVLLASRNFDAIFADLPALAGSQTLAGWLKQRNMESRDDVAVHLALPPYMAAGHYRALWERLRCSQAKSLIWTKLDEACSFGNLINVGHLTGLAISALSFEPGAASAMAEASAQTLWKLVFSHQMPAPVQAGAQGAVRAA